MNAELEAEGVQVSRDGLKTIAALGTGPFGLIYNCASERVERVCRFAIIWIP